MEKKRAAMILAHKEMHIGDFIRRKVGRDKEEFIWQILEIKEYESYGSGKKVSFHIRLFKGQKKGNYTNKNLITYCDFDEELEIYDRKEMKALMFLLD